MRKLSLMVLGVAAISLAGASWLERYLRSEPRPLVQAAHSRDAERPPLDGCTTGQLDRRRPRAWSVIEEAAIYAAVVRSEFIPLSHDGSAVARPREIVIDPRTIDPWIHRRVTSDPWPMNLACDRMPGLRISTAVSFRRANRHPGAPVFRLFSLPIAVRFSRPTTALLDALDGTAGYVRLSRVGFSDDFEQALVMVERFVSVGFGEGTYYLVERRGGPWRIVARAGIWVT